MQAKAKLKELLSVDAAHGAAHNALGVICLDEGSLYKASLEFQIAAKLMIYASEPCYNLGMAFERGGQYDLAIREYRRALERKPNELKVMENLARALVRRGEHGVELSDLVERCLQQEKDPAWRAWLQLQQPGSARRRGTPESAPAGLELRSRVP